MDVHATGVVAGAVRSKVDDVASSEICGVELPSFVHSFPDT